MKFPFLAFMNLSFTLGATQLHVISLDLPLLLPTVTLVS